MGRQEFAERYRQLTCGIALRTLHEVFAADTEGLVEMVTLDGRVSTVNKATGKPDRPRLVSVRVGREQFDDLVLANVDPVACIKELGARVSPHPHEFEPVEPVFDFEALVAGLKLSESADVLSSLDSRPNLLELTPSDFESFVKQLFEEMGKKRGWKAWKTRDVGDDGVDAVVTSDDLIFRGKCVVQIFEYENLIQLCKDHLGIDVLIGLPRKPPRRRKPE